MTGDLSLYVWGSFAMGVALVATELALLHVRERAIRRHLGRRRDAIASDATPRDDQVAPKAAA